MSLAAFKSAKPSLAVVLGSGLGSVADALGVEASLPYTEVAGLPMSKVPGHSGRFLLVRPRGVPVVIAQGRSHLYEGLSAHEVTAHVRFLAEELGIKQLVLTNAAGAISTQLKVGGLMLISDHLNLSGTTPLLGGPHFHDMTEVYSVRLRSLLQKIAAGRGIELYEGVYASLLGPQYETPAEVRMLRTLGADAVGMSTVLEAIQARALRVEVAGISTLTNWAAGLSAGATLNHQEVVDVGRSASEVLSSLLADLAGEV